MTRPAQLDALYRRLSNRAVAIRAYQKRCEREMDKAREDARWAELAAMRMMVGSVVYAAHWSVTAEPVEASRG